MRKTLLLIFMLLANIIQCLAQTTYPIDLSTKDEREGIYAFTNATIFTQYNQKIENATLLIKKGVIEAVGKSVDIPKNAIIIDLSGKYIYPSFIDIYTDYGMPETKKKGNENNQPQFLSNKKGPFGWNEAIKPETNARDNFNTNDAKAKEYRDLGFGTVVTHLKDGISRGVGAAVLLTDKKENQVIIKDKTAAFYSFNKGSSTQNYPESQMGAIALIRQTYLDAEWYAKSDKKTLNLSLEAWNNSQTLPQVFEVSDRLSALRADKIGDEFKIQYLIKGSGDEYQRINELKATNASFIIPINFPEAYDVEDPFDAENVSLAEMKHWELAPTNPAKLNSAGINFAFTTSDIKDKKKFIDNIKKTIKYGLKEEDALKALTFTPANLMGIFNQVGSLEKNKIANFLITSKPIFDEKNTLLENWIKGEKYAYKPLTTTDLRGKYNLTIDGKNYVMEINGEDTENTKTQIAVKDTTKVSAKYLLKEQAITLSFNPVPPPIEAKKDTSAANKTKITEPEKPKLPDTFIRLSGWINNDGKQWKGNGQLTDGKWISWTANFIEALKPKPDKDKKEEKPKPEPEKLAEITYPFVSYGWTQAPKTETILIKNATLWTNENEGILKNADLLIQNGKITAVGKNLTAPTNSTTYDANQKHVTAGIIDEHSHIAISKGVNEGSQNCTAEVRIGDVINSEDINIYRNLSGGVVASQLLHGSANPIGGQSGLIKLRWGQAPEKMKIENSDEFIKFALGENVKQSNWGDNNTIRYPQTRMGVEQIYIDYFTRAKEYESLKLNKNIPFRKDIELEALLEIINKKRFITCHSYVQSEITMLMRVAEKFNFKINTFTHILEGYKVADKMKTHGVNASTFSDWWAYKYEVYDAIPHNAAILTKMGVNTCINSDDAEMARRLNQEAAKAITYGGLSEEEAWKLCTLNPAKALHLDKQTGSLKVGKDADIVIWSDNPLSIYAKVEKTFVDGICLYDKEKDALMQTQINSERNRLIQKMIGVKKEGGDTQKPNAAKRKLYHCTDLGDDEYTNIYDQEKDAH